MAIDVFAVAISRAYAVSLLMAPGRNLGAIRAQPWTRKGSIMGNAVLRLLYISKCVHTAIDRLYGRSERAILLLDAGLTLLELVEFGKNDLQGLVQS